MKRHLRGLLPALVVLFCLLTPGLAEQKNGFLITVQKTTLTRDDYRGQGVFDDKIDRTLGLKIAIKNTTMKDMEAGTLEYIILVERWGYDRRRFDRYEGKVDLVALKPLELANVVAGSAKLGGYKDFNGKYQDKIEGWKIVIRQGGVEKVNMQSSASFDRSNEKAVKPSDSQ